MSPRTPALTDFRRIVVKVGSSLLVDAEAGRVKEDWLASLAADIAELHRRQARSPGRVLGRDRARPLGAAAAAGPAAARGQPGRGRGRPDRARAHLGAGAVAPRHHGRAGAGHAAGHRGAPPLPQRPLHHRAAARMARRAGDQRERHRGDQRDPLWRQRPARGARRHHGERRPLVLLSDVDGLYDAPPATNAQAKLVPVVSPSRRRSRPWPGGAASELSRGGMQTKIEAGKIATRAGTHMVIASGRIEHPLRAIAAGARCTWFLTPANPVTARKKWIAGSLEPQGRADHRCRRGRGAAAAARACCRPASSGSTGSSRAAMR